jgi:hypothetical protein
MIPAPPVFAFGFLQIVLHHGWAVTAFGYRRLAFDAKRRDEVRRASPKIFASVISRPQSFPKITRPSFPSSCIQEEGRIQILPYYGNKHLRRFYECSKWPPKLRAGCRKEPRTALVHFQWLGGSAAGEVAGSPPVLRPRLKNAAPSTQDDNIPCCYWQACLPVCDGTVNHVIGGGFRLCGQSGCARISDSRQEGVAPAFDARGADSVFPCESY